MIAALSPHPVEIVVQSTESFRAGLIRRLVIPLLAPKQIMQDPARFARTVAAQRRKGDAPPPDSMLRRFSITNEDVDGSRVYCVEPRGADRRTIIYIHGGAYVANMVPRQWRIVDGLASRTGAKLLVPNYPLAPEHDWRPAHHMLTMLYEQCLGDTAPAAITIMGDSAGGGLALSLAQAWRDEGRPLPGQIVLLSPWLDLRPDNPGQYPFETIDPMMARRGLGWAAEQWAGTTRFESPRISPGLGNLSGLPPILMFSGTLDVLHSDALDLAAKAEEAGLELKFVIGQNMLHAWSILPIPEAEHLYDMTAAFLERDFIASGAG